MQFADPYGPGGLGYAAYDAKNYGVKPPNMPPYAREQRRRMNMAGIVVCLFVPWITFAIDYAFMSFSVRYYRPGLCYFIIGLGLVAVLISGLLAMNVLKDRLRGNMDRQPTWFMFLFISMLVAWVLALVLGDMNFWQNLQPYYDILHLNTYPSVDPSKMRGQQLMDAGRIEFSEKSKLDLKKTVGFKNLEIYCVAPITEGDATLSTYDFWAVGLNCCSGGSDDFHCGEYDNPKAKSGLRLMNDDQRSFYRLAVQEAEATYNIRAEHPLFFHWMQDPTEEMNGYQEDGVKYYLLGMFAHFAFQLFAVVSASIVFSKLGV